MTPSTPKTCYLQGLDKSLTYDVTIYGSRGVLPSDHIMEVTINGVTETYNAGGSAGEGYVTLTNLSTDSNGEIRIDLRCASTSASTFFNIIDFTAVPEPATMLMLVIGAGIGIGRKK